MMEKRETIVVIEELSTIVSRCKVTGIGLFNSRSDVKGLGSNLMT
jgi:hypothetical protein